METMETPMEILQLEENLSHGTLIGKITNRRKPLRCLLKTGRMAQGNEGNTGDKPDGEVPLPVVSCFQPVLSCTRSPGMSRLTAPVSRIATWMEFGLAQERLDQEREVARCLMSIPGWEESLDRAIRAREDRCPAFRGERAHPVKRIVRSVPEPFCLNCGAVPPGVPSSMPALVG